MSSAVLHSKIFRCVTALNRNLKISAATIHTSPITNDDIKMEKSVNQVTLLGRVGSDAQTRGTVEHPVVLFSLATHNNYKYETGDTFQRTEWHRISVFKPGLREIVQQYVKKGQRVYITGKLSYGEIKTDDGQIRSTANIIADDVIFMQSAAS